MQVLAQISPTLSPTTPPPTAPAKQIANAEKLAEDVPEILKDSRIKPRPARRTANSSMTKAVIQRALLAVRKNRVSLSQLFELLFSVRIIRIAIRMVSQRQLPVSALDLNLSSRPRDPEHLVIISFCISCQKKSPSFITMFILCVVR